MQRYIHEIAAKNKQTKQQCEDGIDNTTKKKNNNGKSLSSNSKNPALVTIHFFFAFSMCCREVIYAENKIIKWTVLRRICFGRLFFSKPKIIIKAVRYDYLFWKGKKVETRKIAQTKLIRGTKKPYFSVNWKENHNETFFFISFLHPIHLATHRQKLLLRKIVVANVISIGRMLEKLCVRLADNWWNPPEPQQR